MDDKRNGFGRYESVSGNYVYEGFWKDDIKDKSGELMKRSVSQSVVALLGVSIASDFNLFKD